jgi:hypothetical protein
LIRDLSLLLSGSAYDSIVLVTKKKPSADIVMVRFTCCAAQTRAFELPTASDEVSLTRARET